jgi:decaprenylphospho-beta-D-ribofuranose 2-oxidase
MVSKNKMALAGWGNYPIVESEVVKPKSEEELRKLIIQSQLIPRGLGRSYGDQAVSENGIVAICTKLDHFISFDDREGILECEAGVSLAAIISVFAPRGWLPMICPGTKYVTIGGAIANDIHGKAHHIDGSFVNCLISFSVMLADGSIKIACRSENSDLFWGSVGGLGLLGVILTAKIKLRRITSTYFQQKSMVVKNLDEMLDALDRNDKEYNYSVAWVDSLAKGKRIGSGVLTLGNAAAIADLPDELKLEPLKVSGDPKLSVPVFFPDFALNQFTVHLLNKVIGFVQNSPKALVHYEKFFFPLDAIHNWNRGYGKRGFIQYQFVIPEEKGKENLLKILTKITQSGCSPFLNVLKKMGKGQGILSFPFEGYTLAIDFPVTKKLIPFTRELDQLVLEARGRIYLGKDALLTKEMFQKMYPQYKDWLLIKKKYDPDNVFTSNISRRLGLEN